VRSFKVEAENVDGNDVVAVFEAAHRAVEKCRRGEGPVFLECMTYRWLEHVGPYFDHELDRTYRTQAEVQNWQDRCPVKRSGESLIADGLATTDELESWEREAQSNVDDSITRAYADPWPTTETLFDNVY
jgi:TPP-dependent pyruvate/acetoin dehydrogenase alpha subunit